MIQDDLLAKKDEIFARFTEAGQGHVFQWWGELDDDGRRRLLAQLVEVDLEHLGRLVADLRAGRLKPSLPAGEVSPPPYVPLPSSIEEEMQRHEARRKGEALLRQGKVAVVTVAGGQGTRLGFSGPKGTYPIGPVSRRSIFQVHAERILATRRRYRAPLVWYIMTSDSTHEGTIAHFEQHDYFGLPADDVKFFRQRMLPAVDRNFKLVMIAKDRILTSPNGHGGTLLALRESGMLDDMTDRGIEEISYFQVDNPLVPAADPIFIGFHADAGAQMSSKAIWKRDPDEPLGAFVRIGERIVIVEYSDLSPEEKRRTTPDGKLLYGLGSPAIHMIRVDFVRAETEGGFRLPYHVAEKRSEFLDEQGNLRTPSGNNVYKFETFIFDALRDAERSIILEVRREEEFSPVKNAEGPDSPETCRRDMSALYASWLEDTGIEVPRDADGRPIHPIEISPLYALDRAELAAVAPRDLRVDGPICLGPRP